MKWWLAFLTLSGLSVSFWLFIGILRFLSEWIFCHGPKEGRQRSMITREQVAVLVPAHNEEVSIGGTLQSLLQLVPREQIYVGSDASSDRTVELAHSFGCSVVDIRPNRGKARVLVELLRRFQILDRYQAVLFVDADTNVDAHYLEQALPFLNDPKVVAVAGHAIPRWELHRFVRWSSFFTAYRIRLYRVLQATLRYGQTWRYTNVTSIIPGFASLYRTSALRQIDIAAPGLIIEDFNMTFEIHHKKLGKIAYDPRIFAISHEPTSFRDYRRQVKRWNLGFWQTVRRHGIWPGAFWLAQGVFQVEMLLYGFFLLTAPLLLLLSLFAGFSPVVVALPDPLPLLLVYHPSDLFLGIFGADYLLTVIVAAIERKPSLLLYGLGFILLRAVDVFLYLWTLPLSFRVRSDGTWTSPRR
jgi:cellulose synthase/poly-beta-1,6-N-acetylglucosamine synthase-like glycosyltransferase